jgi:DNA-binding CsgD family transcriptional regulator
VELTPRQQQIMELLRAGKVNKEIARELGIGVGTVKQHVVTLFKRLNVRNRTMAVSRGLAIADQRAEQRTGQRAAEPATAAAGMLERRPCIVLSLALPVTADEGAVHRLHDSLAALAFELDAVCLARRGNAGDLIFGLHQVGERDLIKAMRCAQRLFEIFHAGMPELAAGLRGGMTAGIVVASMLRHGGWSGEAIVSTAIAGARELQEQAGPGQVALGLTVLDLMLAMGVRGDMLFGPDQAPGAVEFAALARMDWRGERIAYPLVGRAAERKALERWLRGAAAGQGQLLLLEGETGMGKSRLCKDLLAQTQAQGVLHRVRPEAAQRHDGAGPDDAAEITALLRGLAPGALAIVDDYHFLQPAQRSAVLAAAHAAVQAGILVVLAGRHVPETEAEQGPRIALRRQSAREIEALVRQVPAAQGMPAAQVQQIVADAAGVPLFAVELARHCHEVGVALPLLATVIARLDSLRLDRKLLRAAARRSIPPTGAEIAAMLGEPEQAVSEAVQRAIAGGVLVADDAGRLDFGHPLLRKIIDYLSLE